MALLSLLVFSLRRKEDNQIGRKGGKKVRQREVERGRKKEAEAKKQSGFSGRTKGYRECAAEAESASESK